MKRILLLCSAVFALSLTTQAQDTLLWEDFNDTIIGVTTSDLLEDYPSGTVNDPLWYSYDEDQFADGSGGNRPGNWFLLGGGFASVDSLDICLGANSWFSPADQAKNWFILPSIQITDGASAVLSWVAAPRQTPYYLDGYKVLISTTDNALTSFTDTVYVAAEYLSGAFAGSNNYANYTFSSGFVHGMDGNFVECIACAVAGDSARQIGIQRPSSVSLAAYDNQKIYVAFLHDATDDNLISIDDILITETTDPTFSVESNIEFVGSIYPNPVSDYINVNLDINQYTNIRVEMYNTSGQMVYTSVVNTNNHRISVVGMPAGAYFVKVIANEGAMTKKMIVTK